MTGDGAERVKVVGIGGSFRVGSASLAALDIALHAAATAGAAVERFSVSDLHLPLFDHDPTPPPPAAALQLATAVADADALIWSSPMYHGTISGAFKNALDWLQILAGHDPPFLTGKPVGLISAAGGTQALQAVNTMDFIARALRAWVVPFAVPIQQTWGVFDSAGRARDDVHTQLQTLAHEVVTAATMLSPRLGGQPPLVAARTEESAT